MKLHKGWPPAASVTVVDVPRHHWWQRRQVRLRCTCGWTSPQTWPARTYTELAYSNHRLRLALAAIHLDRNHS